MVSTLSDETMAERLSEPQDWVKDVEMRVSREGFNFAQKRHQRFWVLSFRNIAIDCHVPLDRYKAEQNTYWCRPPADRGFRYRYAGGRFDDYWTENEFTIKITQYCRGL
jgi:hypothetical protein